MPKKTKQKKANQKEKTTNKPPAGYKLTEPFLKDYLNLSDDRQKSVDKTLKIIKKEKKFTPGMRAKKLTNNFYYLRTNKGDRITYKIGKNGIIILRRVGGHEILKKP